MLQRLDRYVGPLAVLAVVVVLLLGTYAQFNLPYHRGDPHPQGCYFSDLLFVGIQCGEATPAVVGAVLQWSWYLTWGMFWLLSIALVAPIFGVPVLTLWLGAITLAIRWVWRTLRPRS